MNRNTYLNAQMSTSFRKTSYWMVGILILMGACNTPEKKTQEVKELPEISLKATMVIDTMEALTDIAFPPNGDLWVTEQSGKISVIRDGELQEELLLDITDKTVPMHNGYEERGILGIALHPDFEHNNKFYLHYSRPSTEGSNHTSVVSEFTFNGATADADSERVILTQEQPDGNHNGGCVKFGPDGYLYISFGDGGGQHDEHGAIGNGQDLTTWLGKILRIDVNAESPYVVPADNPFVNTTDARPEIWAYGFRNPYRMSFDKSTGKLFVGEVGQDLWEEVDIIEKGGNYGWKILEGTHCHNSENKPDSSCDKSLMIMPIAEYSHKVGVSITGGFVYQGETIPELKGRYVFADWTGPFFYLEQQEDEWTRASIVMNDLPENSKITGISEDRNGELYFLTNPDTGPGNKKCGIYKITK
ncbi:PQQ-dependent sugar dehydrogenase [Fulvivirga ligni]|uniref:PQQ-dependent sugar dehydrogenase n=1 Tax=Fulvivirga ligni TaxID=2904246 RepID=UPI001F2E0ACA|nr:PQQ-dependent sugar dehydrogenase [Fulvivirga ligni]UII18961.1 PQQ-dependent sugar dehydrogenase [Fulvivirga ligni]